ncbi:hypothetical protein [Enterococcus timonensis]|uniref:hypothetical protein n=1 Tax=Enterococcus timonensis TaxID=1852364 RepID=UPI0008D9FC81|nr:hypothetical protein [Enterococcus timonensis]
MQKTVGKCFRAKSDQYLGSIRIYGSWYDYKVTEGTPEVGSMLEVTNYSPRELFVRVNNYLFESDVNFIVE